MNIRDRKNNSGRTRLYGDFEPNPMDSLTNFSDVMLVLAVGLMTAIVLRWNVPVGQPSLTGTSAADPYAAADGVPGAVGTEDGNTGNPKSRASFSGKDLEVLEDIPQGTQEVGKLYYDEKTDTYYLLVP